MKHSLRALLVVLLLLMLSATAWAYTDTQNLNSAETAALNALSDMEVVNGYPDGSFKPAATVTRAEFAKMLCVYIGETELVSSAASFADVQPGAWYYGWVNRAAEQGLINGYPGGEYRPQNTITQQEIATVLVRLSGVSTTGFAWPDDYIAAAQKNGLFKDFVFVGAANASRIVACQMLYSALPPEQEEEEEKSVVTSVVRGIVTELSSSGITLKDGKGVETAYNVQGNLLPGNLIKGAYLELEVAGKNVVKVMESVIAKKSAAYWDVALDGKSVVINDKKYDLTEAEIFTVEYTLNKTYSSDTFINGGPIDRDILSLGGRLAAEMGIILDENGSTLKAAYLVNASIIVSGGRLDVVEGGYSSAKGSGLYFLGREAGLAADTGNTALPTNGQFIHYTLKNGVISSFTVLFDINTGDFYNTATALRSAGAGDPYAWLNEDGSPDTAYAGNIMQDSLPKVVDMVNGGRVLQIGADDVTCNNYYLAEGCLVYEVKNGEITQSSRRDIEKGDEVLALVNTDSEICYIFCFK